MEGVGAVRLEGVRRAIWIGLLSSLVGGLTACAGGYAKMAPSSAVDYAPAPAAAAEPAPSGGDKDMASDFRLAGEEQKQEGLMASAGGQPAAPAAAATGVSQQTPPKGPSEIAAVRGPLLIYTAQITMAVFEVNAALGAIEELSRELGGFLARRDDMSITIRVPVAAFDAAVKRIERSGDMLHRNVTAQDVTEEYRDLEIRIRNARAVRDRLEQLLAKATKVEESVVVERELERVAGELERLEGRIKFLRDRAAFSTITVTFQPKQQQEITKTPFRLPVPWLNELGLGRLLSL